MLFELFTKIINISLTASVVILVVWVARGFLWKAPKKYAYVLWLIVGIRLLCPVGIASPLSIYNFVGNGSMQIEQYKSTEQNVDTNHDNENYDMSQNRKGDSGASVSDVSVKADTKVINDNIAKKQDMPSVDSASTGGRSKSTEEELNGLIRIASYVWVSVCVMIALWNIYLMFRMKREVSKSVRFKENIYECENIPTPFVMGLISPKIYIPFRLKKEEQTYIINHEKFHIKRKDNVVKMVAFFICCIYWFHPLVWISYLLMIRDMEMSCDEYVLQKSPEDIRVAYSESLLGFAMNKRNLGVGFLAFGESDTRKRVKHIMKFKGYGKWIGIVAVILLIVVGMSCLTDTYNIKNSVDKEKTVKKFKPMNKSFWQDGNIFTAWLTRGRNDGKVSKPCVVLVKEKAKNKYDVIIRCDFNKEYDNIHLGTFTVSENEIIKEVDGHQEIVWAKNEVSDKLLVDQKGSHNSIKIEGKEVKYSYYNNQVETGYYERITFTKEKKLEEFVSGFGAERDLIQLEGIEFNSDNIIELTSGVGTGTWYSSYYNIKKDTFSKQYWYTIARYGDDRIAYITDTKKIAIIDLFSKKKERAYALDFSNSIAVPGELVTKAQFVNRDELRVTYVSGGDYKEITKTINVNMYTDKELGNISSNGIEDIQDKNILKVLRNEKKYYNTEFQKELYLKDYSSGNTVNWRIEEEKCTYSNDSWKEDFTIACWCEVDMDGDGNKEVILQSDRGTELVLHSAEDIVYAWAFRFRSMKNIKVDGTFESSGGAADTEIWKLQFRDGECYCEEICINDELEKGKEIYRINKKTSSKRKVKKYLAQQNQKEEVVWIKY